MGVITVSSYCVADISDKWRSSDLTQKLMDEDKDEDEDEEDEIIPPHQISSACQRQSGAKHLPFVNHSWLMT